MVIENEINLFIKSEENNGALLITGKWGCGKSYLIKECASDLEVKDHYAIAIISLFGVDTIATLNKKVRNAYLEFASGVFGKKARKIYGTLKKVATDSANITAAALPRSRACTPSTRTAATTMPSPTPAPPTTPTMYSALPLIPAPPTPTWPTSWPGTTPA